MDFLVLSEAGKTTVSRSPAVFLFVCFCNSRTVTLGFLPCHIRVAFPGVCLCFHNPPNSDMDFKVFNVCTDVNVCDCTRGDNRQPLTHLESHDYLLKMVHYDELANVKKQINV